MEAIMEIERRRQVDRDLIDGYRLTSLSEAERDAAVASLRDAILEEPWGPAERSGPQSTAERQAELR